MAHIQWYICCPVCSYSWSPPSENMRLPVNSKAFLDIPLVQLLRIAVPPPQPWRSEMLLTVIRNHNITGTAEAPRCPKHSVDSSLSSESFEHLRQRGVLS